jgi:hypothetical protein
MHKGTNLLQHFLRHGIKDRTNGYKLTCSIFWLLTRRSLYAGKEEERGDGDEEEVEDRHESYGLSPVSKHVDGFVCANGSTRNEETNPEWLYRVVCVWVIKRTRINFVRWIQLSIDGGEREEELEKTREEERRGREELSSVVYMAQRSRKCNSGLSAGPVC